MYKLITSVWPWSDYFSMTVLLRFHAAVITPAEIQEVLTTYTSPYWMCISFSFHVGLFACSIVCILMVSYNSEEIKGCAHFLEPVFRVEEMWENLSETKQTFSHFLIHSDILKKHRTKIQVWRFSVYKRHG